MTSSRSDALARIRAYFDDRQKGYLADLQALVAVPTESQNPERLGDLHRYLDREMAPRFARLGYTTRILDNPRKGAGPVLLATRIEDPSLATILGYGHGDVVLGMAGRWAEGRDPWRVTIDGGKAFGRGVVDNKGQHLAHLAALETVLAARGRLGFNSKFLIEMGEETGSPGLDEIVRANAADFAADAFFASDGPRTEIGHPNITLGNRGAATFELKVRSREGGHHSGNWGGLLANPGIVLAHALATITDAKGRILVEAWRPEIPAGVREVLKGVDRDGGPGAPAIDDAWGEPGLSRIEKVVAFNAFEVLAFETGNSAAPVNAIPPTARAVCQLRYVVGTAQERILDGLREHLAARGLGMVEVAGPPTGASELFTASRTDHAHPYAVWLRDAVTRAAGDRCRVLPNGGGSNMTWIMQYLVGMPCAWLPLSYAGCSQHAPNEHLLLPLTRTGLEIVTSVYWDLGDPTAGYRPGR